MYKGPWYHALLFLESTELYINRLLKRCEGHFSVRMLDFSEPMSLTLEDDFKMLFQQLQSSPQKYMIMAQNLIEEIGVYIHDVMYHAIRQLELIIVLQSFFVKGKPIIDLFYTYDDQNERVMRKPEEFYMLIGGSFMTYYYKVSLLCSVYFV